MKLKWVFATVLYAFAVASTLAWAAETSPEYSQYQVEAAFLLNFGRFTDWPPSAFKNSGTLNLCILGRDPFGRDLDQVVEHQVVHGRAIRILRLEDPQSIQDCQILYISLSEKEKVRTALSAAPKNLTLTVSGAPDFIGEGGMIQLFIEERHVRFAINLKAAEGAGLRISSKLLQIADVVERDPPEKQ